jgi:hypothetical protein
MHIRSLILASVAAIALASPSFANGLCHERTIETPNTADNFVKQFGPYAGSSQEGGYDYAAQLLVCTDPNSDHPFAEAMKRNGACVNTGRHLRSMTSHTGGSPYLGIKNLKNGDVPDYTQTRVGFYIGNHWVGSDWKGTADNPRSC